MSTRNIVPRNDEEGGIGTSIKRWLSGFFKDLDVSNSITLSEETTVSSQSYKEGKIFYDSSHKMPAFYSTLTDDALRIGQTTVLRSKNTTGSTINKMQAVSVTGADGVHSPVIGLAQADTAENARVLGLAMEDIADQGNGLVLNRGMIHNVDTSAWAPGTELFLSDSVAGGLTSTKPSIVIFIGWVINQDASSGSIELMVADFFTNQGDMLKSVYDTDDDGIIDQSLPADFQYSEDNTESSTTATTFQDKLSLTFTPPASGDYIIDWYCETSNSGNSKHTEIRVLQDATNLSQTALVPGISYPDEWNGVSGFKKVSLVNQSYTFKIQFRVNGNTGYIRNTRLMARRVS